MDRREFDALLRIRIDAIKEGFIDPDASCLVGAAYKKPYYTIGSRPALIEKLSEKWPYISLNPGQIIDAGFRKFHIGEDDDSAVKYDWSLICKDIEETKARCQAEKANKQATPSQPSPPPPASKLEPPPKPQFKCKRCPESFSSNTQLYRHIEAHHTPKSVETSQTAPPAPPAAPAPSSPASSPSSTTKQAPSPPSTPSPAPQFVEKPSIAAAPIETAPPPAPPASPPH
ncbi:MAG: hypothetical protein Q9178_001983 [Gyalolechia marmorata]